jgi:transposase
MSRLTVITGRERRRRWSSGERREILMAAFAPGSVVADISRQYEVSTSLIYKWRREVLASQAEAQFIPAVIVDGPPEAEPAVHHEPAIVVELAGGVRVTIGASAPASMVSATLRALR